MFKYSFLFIFLLGCKTIKQSVQTDNKDSVRIEIREVKIPSVNDTITIENPCDSLGLISRFKSLNSYGQGKVLVESKQGKLKVYIKLKEYITKDSLVYKYKYITKTEYKEVEKKNFPYWIIFLAGGLILVLIQLKF